MMMIQMQKALGFSRTYSVQSSQVRGLY